MSDSDVKVCLTFDFDALRREGVPATFLVPGITIEASPKLCRRILAEGHEIGQTGFLDESSHGAVATAG